MKTRRNIFFAFLLFVPMLAAAQTDTLKGVTFIGMNKQAGYIIDSLENRKCKCITYVRRNEFRYAALIQLSDSLVVLRIKRAGREGYTDVPMTESMALDLYLSASALNDNTPVDNSNEQALFQVMAGDSIPYRLAEYEKFRFSASGEQQPRRSSGRRGQPSPLVYFHFGGGFGRYHGVSGNLALGIGVGYIYNKNLITVRNYKVTETKGLLGDIQPRENASDFGLLFGQVFDGGRVRIAFSGGISYARGVVRKDFLYGTGGFSGTSYYEKKTFGVVGLPLESILFIGARHDVNISLAAFADLNPEHSFGGILLCFRVGAAKQNN